MRPALKWSLIGCGCLGSGAVALFVGSIALLVGLDAAGIYALPTPAPKPVAVATIAPAAAQPTPIPTLPPVATEAPTAAPQPTAAPAPATLTRVQAAGATVSAKPTAPPAPTATPKPAQQAVELTGKFEPRVLKVGQKLVVELSLTNKSDRPIEGLRFFSSGPWGKFTVVNVVPNGRLESGMLGFNIYTGMVVPPAQTRVVSIVAYPNEPGNHEFSFIPNHDTTPLNGEDGKGIVIGGQVSVTR